MALKEALVGLESSIRIVSDASLRVSLITVAGVILVEIEPAGIVAVPPEAT